jgi:uncharacterized protein YecT (DUF1311 family)
MLMLRLTAVFFIWMASTAYALEEGAADYDAELHEAYVSAWNEADRPRRALLARAQQAWSQYRAAHCELLGDECYALMAQERAAELRYIRGSLIETNVRTILPAHAGAEHSPDER